tara:strand:+ start:255 stop:596 length:342 start_codon:yes stop_codon:yes gene_type:complete
MYNKTNYIAELDDKLNTYINSNNFEEKIIDNYKSLLAYKNNDDKINKKLEENLLEFKEYFIDKINLLNKQIELLQNVNSNIEYINKKITSIKLSIDEYEKLIDYQKKIKLNFN